MRSRQILAIIIVCFQLFFIGCAMASDFDFRPYVTEDGREEVGSASITLDGWTDDEIQRYASRPDFAEVFLESDDPPYASEWAYRFLKENPGKTIAWLDSFLIPQGQSKVSIRKLCWYVIYPSDVARNRDIKAWADSNRWQDLLIKPPVGKWIAVQDSPRSRYLDEWGGGAAGGEIREGKWVGTAGSRLQKQRTFGGTVYCSVAVSLFPDPIPLAHAMRMSLHEGCFYELYEYALEPASDSSVIVRHAFPKRKGVREVPFTSWTWRSGAQMIWIYGEAERGDGLLEAYLKKFPSDLPKDIPLTPEGWVMDRCRRAVPTLREHVSSPDKELGLVGKDPFEGALSDLMLTKDGDMVHTAYLREAQRLAKTLLWEGRRYDWKIYQQSLRALRQQALDQIESLVTAMEQRGIVHDGKKWVVKDPPWPSR